ncbi:integrin-linked protein kinase 1 isoform X1 [Cucurbita pepo subsp. pepo]|uniref:integrin-linked protein kinase 1 isoform X1 n=1 Tax=Cucurbita pepo subsp. pepo TaxID=3664 RepID=UPI000C9D5B89|nr:integrin-linked protein kinase 1 isoform X1 [Cucurbita pepo subsp. pepo]XP_023533997.1 integrin-linked protein kinase 1 isoform X1 [Cucurbita pepo subsp. pepo]
MDSNVRARFTLGKQSSLQPERQGSTAVAEELDDSIAIDPGIKLMYLSNDGDSDGIRELLDSGADVNFRDIDGRTSLHVAACQGRPEIVEILLERGAEVDVQDRWGSTPLADAIYYKNQDVIKLLEKHGARLPMAPMLVQNALEVPEYEINPNELDFSKSVNITKGTFCIASWRGIEVAVKTLGEEVFTDEDKVKAFRDELALLQKIRHPNVVQFLGAVTQSSPMMIVMEYLPQGDLHAYLKRKGSLKLATVVKFALDIARGMNYLHEHKPEAIIHRDLEPSNILRDDSMHLKVADFGVSKLLKLSNRVKEDRPVAVACHDTSWRYVAPEAYKDEEYDTKVDVFSFALILQEMIEGNPPFPTKPENEVPKAYIAGERPPFMAPTKRYADGVKELIEECWEEKPHKRPTFRQIIRRLEDINNEIMHTRSLKMNHFCNCFGNLTALFKRERTSPGSRSFSKSK